MRRTLDTVLMDEAAYYASKGQSYTVHVKGQRRAVWSFIRNEAMDKLRKQFWGGRAEVNLHKWMSLRTSMKLETAIKVVGSPDAPLMNGETYYYINEAGLVKSALYGNAPIHQKRLDEKNFFKTSDEATEHRLKRARI